MSGFLRPAPSSRGAGRADSVWEAGNNREPGVVVEGVVVKGTVSPGLTYCLQGRSFG
ncbi:hypothetical protein GCM10017779_70950 [Streptomyces capillispiralis]|nr:hypothetical protein GCM10017779_70950 [Streptomyces capillispiralis]